MPVLDRPLAVRQATAADLDDVLSILHEAAAWLVRRGTPMWRDDELDVGRIGRNVAEGTFFLAWSGDRPVGTVKCQLSDREFWPDVRDGETIFVHRLAVRREFAGRGVSDALLSFAAERATSLDLRFVRLDCEAARPRLRVLYERSGFRHHSDRQVGPYFVSRYERDLRVRPS